MATTDRLQQARDGIVALGIERRAVANNQDDGLRGAGVGNYLLAEHLTLAAASIALVSRLAEESKTLAYRHPPGAVNLLMRYISEARRLRDGGEG